MTIEAVRARSRLCAHAHVSPVQTSRVWVGARFSNGCFEESEIHKIATTPRIKKSIEKITAAMSFSMLLLLSASLASAVRAMESTTLVIWMSK